MLHSIDDINDALNELFEEQIMPDLNTITPTQRQSCGLDTRAIPPSLMYSKNMIVVPSNNRGSLDYYGGFEYVDKECITQVGDYVIYSSDDDRVNELIDSLYNIAGEVVSDDE